MICVIIAVMHMLCSNNIALYILQLHLQLSSGDGGLGTPGFGEGLPGFCLGLSACSLIGGTCAGNH